MSRYQPSYDSGESRRSPRDQSPGRYNGPRDDFRDGGARGGERRRSIPDVRNHGAFASNRDTFREPIGRESSRDFPPREPPRGPKGMIDPPTGPRASSYSSDFRGEPSYRGDFRAERGRGRGRGIWRDDNRDRSRDDPRDYRDRRDDRPPLRFPREERGGRGSREPWGRENYNGRRQSPPPVRGRSPPYAPRERESLPSLEIDRSRRDSRDGPLSGGSPASDSLSQFGRGGFNRPRGPTGRGGRGRGFHDDYHRTPGRSRSPDTHITPHWNRRTQPSATPPPQVPAFGSTSAQLAPATSAVANSSSTGPLPGVSVPTAPRAERGSVAGRGGMRGGRAGSIQLKIDHSVPPQPFTSPTRAGFSAPTPPSLAAPEKSTQLERKESNYSDGPRRESSIKVSEAMVSQPKSEPLRHVPSLKHKPVFVKHVKRVRAPVATLRDLGGNASDSDSADDADADDTFTHELAGDIARVKVRISQMQRDNSLMPPPDPPGLFLRPFIDSSIDDIIEHMKNLPVEPCVAPPVEIEIMQPKVEKEPTPAPLSVSTEIVPQAEAKVPTSPTLLPPDIEMEMSPKSVEPPKSTGNEIPVAVERMPSPETVRPTTEVQDAPIVAPRPRTKSPSPIHPVLNGEPSNSVAVPETPTEIPVNGNVHKPALDVFDETDGEDTEAENREELESVRRYMKTPPISSLPRFNTKPWNQDVDFTKTLARDHLVDAAIRQKLLKTKARRQREQEEARREWKQYYLEYRRWTDFSDDPVAVRSRETFRAAREQAKAEANHQKNNGSNSGGRGHEGRRTGSRFATEHDFERVLRESEQEAKESKDQEERILERAKTASAKEASIPDMAWDQEEWDEQKFVDFTHIVQFERSFAILEYGEPVDNFTAEENQKFEAAYLDFPKQWGKIAEALSGRDYKACIQHYYLVKHSSNIKEKLKKQPRKKKGRAAKSKKQPISSIADASANRDEDEVQEAENGEGGRRGRPRRAAAPVFPFENHQNQSESEAATPAPTPTPSRKSAAAPKNESSNDHPPKKKTKTAREKTSKQSKNSQLLAAAPVPVTFANPEPTIAPSGSTEWISQHDGAVRPPGTPRFLPQYDGNGPSQPQPNFAPPYVPVERPNPPAPTTLETTTQPFVHQERLDSAPPLSFDGQQDRRNNQQTSSYWSVPEQESFPALLRHFGTDWHAIAKFMTSKTHIMVKNYYTRQVQSNKGWEEIAKDADEKKARGESTGPQPQPTIIPKRRYDITPSTPGLVPRSGSTIDGLDDMIPGTRTPISSHASPPQPPNLITRFPALAQAGPVPQIQPSTPASVLNNHLPPQPIQQAPPQPTPQPRAPRGPPRGYFMTTESPRPIVQADTAASQRSKMVAQEAQLEKQSALRLQNEQREIREQQQQQQQQQVMQRERMLQMKREDDSPMLHQYEQYGTPTMHPGNIQANNMQSRPEPPPMAQASAMPESRPMLENRQISDSRPMSDGRPMAENRRPPPPPPAQQQSQQSQIQQQQQHHQQQAQQHQQQFQSRVPPARNFLAETMSNRETKSNSSPAISRVPMSAPPPNHEAYPTSTQQPNQQQAQPLQPPPPPPAPVAAIRQPEVRKTSSIMSLLNDDPPEPPRSMVTKRMSDVSSTPMQQSHTPPPQHPLQSSRYSAHQPQIPPPQSQQQMAQQMPPQQPQQSHPPSQQYSQQPPPQHVLHQHSSSIGTSRSYTPTGFDNQSRSYGQPSIQQQQQQMYAQSRQSLPPQPPPIRREPSISGSINEMHGITGGYARSSAPSQPRLKDSPYSATPPPQAQIARPPAGSPMDMPQSADRDYYQRPQQTYLMQQQQNTAASPQLGPSYHSQPPPQQPPQHRGFPFGQSTPHVASPPTQYSPHHSVHRSRQNSFDGRYPMTTTSSAPPPSQQGYSPHPMQQYQQSHPGPGPDRYESAFERDRRYQQQEEYHQQQELQRRIEAERRQQEEVRRR